MSSQKTKQRHALAIIEEYKKLYPSFMSPAEVLLLISNGIQPPNCTETIDLKTRIEACKAGAGYFTPKLAPQTTIDITHSFEDKTDDEKKEQIKQLLENPSIKEILAKHGKISNE